MNTTAPALPSTSTPSSVSSLSSCVDNSNGNSVNSPFADILAQTTTPEAVAKPVVTAKATTKSQPKATDKPASDETADNETSTPAQTEASEMAAVGTPVETSMASALINTQILAVAQMVPQVIQPQVANVVVPAPKQTQATQTAVAAVAGKAADTASQIAVTNTVTVVNTVTPDIAQLVDASTTTTSVAGGLKAQTIAKSADTPIAITPANPESIPAQATNSQPQIGVPTPSSTATQQPAVASRIETKVVTNVTSAPAPVVSLPSVQAPVPQATPVVGTAPQTVSGVTPQNQPASPSPTNVVNNEQVATTQAKEATASTQVQADAEVPEASDSQPVVTTVPVQTTLPNDIRPAMTRVTDQTQPTGKKAEAKAANKVDMPAGREILDNSAETEVQPGIASHIETGIVTDTLAPLKTAGPNLDSIQPGAPEPIPASNTLAAASATTVPASAGTVIAGNAEPAQQAPVSTYPKVAAHGSPLSEAVTSKSATISAAVIEAANPTDNIQPQNRNVAMERSTMVSLGSTAAAESSTSQTGHGEEQSAGSKQRGSSPGPESLETKPLSGVSGSAASSESFKTEKVEATFQPASHTADRLRVIDQVTQKLDTMRLVNGRQEMNINLRPDHLGEVKLTIVADKHNVTAHIVAETSSARDAMQNGRDHLREALEQKGYTLQGLDVSLSNNGGEQRFAAFQQNAHMPHAPQGSSRGNGLTETATTTDSNTRSAERALSAAGRLDYEA